MNNRAKYGLSALAGLMMLCSAQAHAKKIWNLSTLHTFCTAAECADGMSPSTGLVRDADGIFFGVTMTGGAHGDGVIYEIKRKRSGFSFRVIHDFCAACGEGDGPLGSLVVDGQGNLYGTTSGGGAHHCGTAFMLARKKWKFSKLHDFCADADDGEEPFAALAYAGKSSGALYDGVSPLYGITAGGGAHGHGIVYALQPSGAAWSASPVFAFCAQAQCSDGWGASGEVLVDAKGDLYGNAQFGGTTGGGIVYKLSPVSGRRAMSQEAIHTFCLEEDCVDGQGPTGALVMDAAGAIYGTTENTDREDGSLFRLSFDGGAWQHAMLHRFCSPPDCADGYAPSSGLTMGPDGAIYGVTELGGTGENGIGGGAAFRLKGGKFSAIYEFCSLDNCADGRVPLGAVALDADGTLLGTTSQGGQTSAAGTAYALAQ